MLVLEYLDQIIAARPYKYSIKQTLVKDIKRMGIWDMDISLVNSGLIRDSELMLFDLRIISGSRFVIFPRAYLRGDLLPSMSNWRAQA